MLSISKDIRGDIPMTLKDMLPIEDITPKTIRTALTNWRKGKRAPTALLKLALLGDRDMEYLYIRDVMLYDTVVGVVLGRLAVLRRRDDVETLEMQADSRDDVLDQLQLDFTQASQETVTNLMAYSALYFRHITEIEIPVSELAMAAGVTQRHFRRSAKTGIELLAQELRRQEFKARGSLDAISGEGDDGTR